MLTNETIEKINNQIQDDLDTVGSFVRNDHDKAAALDRITKLKQVLDPNPSPAQTMDALVQALKSHQTNVEHVEPIKTLGDLFTAFCR